MTSMTRDDAAGSVRLRAFTENDLPFLDRLCTDPDVLGEFEWPGFIDPRTRRQRWERDGYISAEGTAAQDLLVEYLLDHTTAQRIEALTNDANIGEQKALERLGFRREGLMRGRSFLRGTYVGVLIYGLLREDRRPAT